MKYTQEPKNSVCLILNKSKTVLNLSFRTVILDISKNSFSRSQERKAIKLIWRQHKSSGHNLALVSIRALKTMGGETSACLLCDA